MLPPSFPGPPPVGDPVAAPPLPQPATIPKAQAQPAQAVDDPTSHGVTAPFESKLEGRSLPAAFDMMRYAIGVLSRARRAV